MGIWSEGSMGSSPRAPVGRSYHVYWRQTSLGTEKTSRTRERNIWLWRLQTTIFYCRFLECLCKIMRLCRTDRTKKSVHIVFQVVITHLKSLQTLTNRLWNKKQLGGESHFGNLVQFRTQIWKNLSNSIKNIKTFALYIWKILKNHWESKISLMNCAHLPLND